ncbi:MAG: DUF2087 domain-containing protein [Bacillota bacterium]
MELNERFWSSSIEELKQGYVYDESAGMYYCLICGQSFEEGEVFHLEQAGRWYEARKYAAYHVQQAHGSILDCLLELDKKATGLTDLQKELIRGFADDLSDGEMMQRTGVGSASTIRNHRFVLKEKAKQAKLIVAIMELMEQGAVTAPRFVPVHRTATQVDDRYAITEDEYAGLIKQYFPNGPEGPLASFPRKEKRKIAVLRHISSYFQSGMIYKEKDVNEQLSRFWADDYVTLRRYLIEYGYLDRKDDGSEYWVKELGDDTGELDRPKEQKQEQKPDQQESKVERKGGHKMEKAQRKHLTSEYQERERVMGVFQITNKVNGRKFVGGSTNLDAVWGKEQFLLNIDGHTNKELQKEWKQYGSENFTFLILETVKFDHQVRYDYKDVFAAEGRQPIDMVRHYNREVAALKEQWLEKLQPYGEKGYHRLADEVKE